MKDPDFELRTLYNDALQGITYGSKSVPIYSRVPNDADGFWVKLHTISASDDSDKDAFTTERLFSVIVHDVYRKGGSFKRLDSIASEVLNRLVGIKFPSSVDFVFHEQELESSDVVEEASGGYYVVEKLLIIRNYIQQYGN